MTFVFHPEQWQDGKLLVVPIHFPYDSLQLTSKLTENSNAELCRNNSGVENIDHILFAKFR
jgi:hypothetical protein